MPDLIIFEALYHDLPQSIAYSQIKVCSVYYVDEAALFLSSGSSNHCVIWPQNGHLQKTASALRFLYECHHADAFKKKIQMNHN